LQTLDHDALTQLNAVINDPKAAAALAKGAERTHRVSHGIYELEAANSSGGFIKTNLIDGLVSAGLEYVGPQTAPQQAIAAPRPVAVPAATSPEECHRQAQQAELAGDLAGAFRLYGTAAMQGHPPAMNDLGYCYEKGQGVTQDKALAASWYRAAAARGHPNAIRNLADLEAEERRNNHASEEARARATEQRGTPEWARMKLGVGPQATEQEIKAAHLRLIGLLHPDRGGFNADAADLNDARRVLLGR